jgi:hypothetical protein
LELKNSSIYEIQLSSLNLKNKITPEVLQYNINPLHGKQVGHHLHGKQAGQHLHGKQPAGQHGKE